MRPKLVSKKWTSGSFRRRSSRRSIVSGMDNVAWGAPRSAMSAMLSSSAVAFRSIAIEGPIGAGKTALAERLGTRLDATVVLEESENPFLADFYADRPGAALQAQLFYLLNRHRQQTSLRQSDLFSQTTICDYLFDKDKIFLPQSRRQRAVHLPASVRAACARRAAARSRGLPAGADRRAAAARTQ